MANRMILNETAWFGRGAVDALTDEVTRRGYHKALIVTDKTLVQCGVVDKVTSRMDAAGLAWEIYAGVIPNPTISVVQEGLKVFTQKRRGLSHRHWRRFSAGYLQSDRYYQ